MRRRVRFAPLVLLLPLVAACTPRSRQLPEGAPARFTLIDRSEFPNGDCTAGSSNTLGVVMLRHAVRTDEALAQICARDGVPDAIAAGADAWTLEVAYFQRHVVYALHRAVSGPSTVTTRTITEADIALISAGGMHAAGSDLPPRTAYGRVFTGLHRLVGAVPANDLELRPGHYPGFLTVAFPLNPFEAVAGDRHETLLVQRISQEVQIAWVDPQGPLETLAQPGDIVEAVDGETLLSEQRLYFGWIGPRTLTVRHGEATHDIVVTPEEWPFDLQVAIVVQDAPLLLSSYLQQRQLLRPPGLSARIVDPGTIVLFTSTGFLDRVDDNELSWALAHELSHVVLGHLTRKPTFTDRLGSVLSAILIPALIVPVAGAAVVTAVTETAGGIRRRANRDQERDADRMGTEIACAAGIGADVGPRLMQAMSTGPQASALRQFFDEHPSYDEREALIRAVAATACERDSDR